MSSVRRLAAILAADVAGYSRLMGADEERTHEQLKAHLGELVNPKIAEHRGRIVKNTGDGFLAELIATTFRSCRRRYTRKLRQRPTIASTPCTTRSAATTFWRMPMPSAAPTRAHRGSTARTLRTSRRTGSSDGWPNWRLRSGKRLTDQSQSDECLYRRPTANSGRWASQACGIGSA